VPIPICPRAHDPSPQRYGAAAYGGKAARVPKLEEIEKIVEEDGAEVTDGALGWLRGQWSWWNPLSEVAASAGYHFDESVPLRPNSLALPRAPCVCPPHYRADHGDADGSSGGEAEGSTGGAKGSASPAAVGEGGSSGGSGAEVDAAMDAMLAAQLQQEEEEARREEAEEAAAEARESVEVGVDGTTSG
jgi:hypothetical protein